MDSSDEEKSNDYINNKNLLFAIDNYCKIYARELKEGHIERSVYASFLSLACFYGFLEKAEDYYDEAYSGIGFSVVFDKFLWQHNLLGIKPVNDLFTALYKIIEYQKCLSVSWWKDEFLTPYRGLEFKLSGAFHRMWRALRTGKLHIQMALLREAVLNEDWTTVGRIVGKLPAIKCKFGGLPLPVQHKLWTTFRHTSIALGPFRATLFSVAFQRFMHHNLDSRFAIRSAVEFMLRLVESDYTVTKVASTYKTRTLGMYCAAEVLIFCIANQLNEEARDLLRAAESFRAKDLRNLLVLRAYSALFSYNLWRVSESEMQSELLQISDKLNGAVKEVPVGEEKVFLVAVIHFLLSVGLPDLLYDIVRDCCFRNPFLFGHCCHTLNAFGSQELARRLMEEFSDISKLSPSDPVLLDWIQARLMDSELFEIDAGFLKRAAETLCNFLDYGENRAVERAWLALSACIKRVDDTYFVAELWSRRQLWWPKFHVVRLSHPADRCRSEVMNILKAASKRH